MRSLSPDLDWLLSLWHNAGKLRVCPSGWLRRSSAEREDNMDKAPVGRALRLRTR